MRPTPFRIIAALVALGASLGMLAALAGCGTSSHSSAATLPAGTSGSITIQTDIATYRTAQPIGVTIQNASKSTFYVQTGQSECTPLQMQRQVGMTWLNVMPCPVNEQPQNAAVTPGLVEPFTFAPGNASSDPNSWVPGIYRFALQLTNSADGSGTSTLVYSPGIRIVAPSA
jgi:hypothetical protein